MRTLNNTVIKNLTREMGGQIIQKYKADGWDTRMCIGDSCELYGHEYIYYGVINDEFNVYTLEQVQAAGAKIIDLEYHNCKPKRGDTVLVWDDDEDGAESRIFLTEIEGAELPFICVSLDDERKFNYGEPFSISLWKHYKFHEENNRLKELEEQYKKLGEEIQKLKS